MNNHFVVSLSWHVAICLSCEHAVGPENIVGYLTGFHHQLTKAKAETIKQELEQRYNVSSTVTFETIHNLDEPIPEPKVHPGGFMRTVESTCNYTAMSENSMKQHC